MGLLTGKEIIKAVEEGQIVIEGYDERNVNPNSYNVTIGKEYKELDFTGLECLDLRQTPTYISYPIPLEGAILYPDKLYLIGINEFINAGCYIPMITGRSSMGRLGIQVHQSAGFGDIGFAGIWTLQVTVKYPTKIYPNWSMAQVYFETPVGSAAIRYNGKYQHQNTTTGYKPDEK